jgi:hypothetical protein
MIKKILQSIWSIITYPFRRKPTLPDKFTLETLTFSCCFCSTSVRPADRNFAQFVIEASAPENNTEQQAYQVYWGHIECLKNKLHPSAQEHLSE